MNLSLINRDGAPTTGFGILQGARIDPVEERREQTQRHIMGARYGFIKFLAEISDGTMQLQEFDQYLGFVVRDESMSETDVCLHVIEQLEREPARLDRANKDVIVRLHLKASMAPV